MARPKSLYRVFLHYVSGNVALAGETLAVSKISAENCLRWRIYGNLSIEALWREKGVRFVATLAGSPRDELFQIRAGKKGLPAPKKRQVLPEQMSLPGVEMFRNAQLL